MAPVLPRPLSGPVLAAALLAALAVPTSGWAQPAVLAVTEHQVTEHHVSATISPGVARSDHAGYTGTLGVGRPADVNGQLRVCGVKLCNRYGKPIQLRGMSTHGIQWYSQ